LATRRRFTQEYQDQAVSLVLLSGRTIRDVAKSIGVHEITLGKWVNKAKGDDSGRGKELSETERAELERKHSGRYFDLRRVGCDELAARCDDLALCPGWRSCRARS